MSKTVAIDLPLKAIREYCATQPIARLSVFGSAARDELTPDSDIDLLVEYDPDAPVGLFAMGGHLMDFQDIVGRKVDLVTPNGLCKYIRDEFLQSARLIYAKDRDTNSDQVYGVLETKIRAFEQIATNVPVKDLVQGDHHNSRTH